MNNEKTMNDWDKVSVSVTQDDLRMSVQIRRDIARKMGEIRGRNPEYWSKRGLELLNAADWEDELEARIKAVLKEPGYPKSALREYLAKKPEELEITPELQARIKEALESDKNEDWEK